MKKFSFVLLLFAVSYSLQAQIGVSGAYSTIKTPGWEDILTKEGSNQFENGYTFGIEYWFKLKNYRVEFLPELSYSIYDNQFDTPLTVASSFQSEMTIMALAFNTQIYLFDIEGDCNCPTWGKDGDFFSKGFYFMLGPGISAISQKAELMNGLDQKTADETSYGLMLNAGAGLDIGISKSLTITAFGKFKWHQARTWDGLEAYTELSPIEIGYTDFDSAITQIEPGLKLSYRWGQ